MNGSDDRKEEEDLYAPLDSPDTNRAWEASPKLKSSSLKQLQEALEWS
jgi:hypothetical protein